MGSGAVSTTGAPLAYRTNEAVILTLLTLNMPSACLHLHACVCTHVNDWGQDERALNLGLHKLGKLSTTELRPKTQSQVNEKLDGVLE